MGTVFHTVRESRGGELVAMGLPGYDATPYGNYDFEKGPGLLPRALEAAGKNALGRLPLVVASNTEVDPLDPGLFGLRDAQHTAPVVPRDASGEPLASPWGARLFDGADGAELKEGVALARFLQSFPDTDGNGLWDVPAAYARPVPHFVPVP